MCDLNKAFGCSSHDIMSNKLSFYDVKGKELSTIKSYLTGKQQIVDINDKKILFSI